MSETMNITSFSSLKDQIDLLVQFEQYNSADILISLYISKYNNKLYRNNLPYDLYELYGDILYNKEDFHRAISCYTQSLYLYKDSNKNNTDLYIKSNNIMISTQIEARIKHKEAKCFIKLNDLATATNELEKIPNNLRNLSINITISSLYKSNGLNQQAINLYKEILKELPYCIEVIESLAQLTNNMNDLIINNNKDDINNINNNISNQTNNKSTSKLINKQSNQNRSDFHYFLSNQLLSDYTLAFYYSKTNDYVIISNKFQHLLKHFPNNMHILQQLGLSYTLCDKEVKAYNIFSSLFISYPHILDTMDVYGLILYHRKDLITLNKLGHDLMKLNVKKPIGWIVVSLYCDLKGMNDKAMEFIDKAISLDAKYSHSYLIKGMYLLAQGQPKQATLCYFQSNLLNKDIRSLNGLIDCHLSLHRFDDAFNLAKETIMLYKKSPKALYLMGKVLATSKSNINECIKAFNKSLKLDPSNELVALRLVDILIKQKRYDEAIEIVKATLQQNESMSGRSITLRIKLSKLLSLIGNYSDALEELHLCSSICAMNEQDSDVVNQELEKLENLIRGNIPDEASRSFIDINDNHNDGTPADDDDDDGDIPSGRQSSRYNPSYSRSRVSSAISYRRNVRTPNRSITFDDEEDDDRPVGRELFAD